MWDPALWTKTAVSSFDAFFFLSYFSWELETSTDLTNNKTRNSFSLLNFFFPSQTGEKSNLLPSATSKIQSQDLLLVVKDVYTERRNRNIAKTEVWLNVNLAWLLYLVFLSPPLKGRIPVAVVAMVLRRTRCLLQSENYVCGCVVNNYPFWQVRLVYSELIQYHFSYSKVGRGSSGHSPCVKANAASAVQEKPEN